MSSFDENDDLRELRELPREVEPPADLEDRLVASLRDRGLIEDSALPVESGRRVGAGGARWAMAAGLMIAALGGWVGRGLMDAAPTSKVGSKEYLVLFAEPNGLQTTKSIPELVEEYSQWGADLGAQGRMVAGRRLEDGSRRLLTDSAGEIATSSEDPLVEATGFFLIRADSWDEAVDLMADSPHLAYGGEISLREVARDG